MCTFPQSDHDHFRTLLYRNNASEILVETTDNGRRLPTVAIPRRTRVAAEITATIQSRWNLAACCLFSLPSDAFSEDWPRYQVAEVSPDDSKSPTGMQWFTTESLNAEPLAESADLVAIQQSQAMFDRYRGCTLSGFFGKPGWLRIVTDWVRDNAAISGLNLTGKFLQFNASPTFSLIRFETDGPALWFKAVGRPNLHEYSITLKLASAFPNFVPKILAAKPEWNAWLTSEGQGSHPDERSGVRVWIAVARQLAQLQIATAGQALHLIDAGCHDVRASSLSDAVDPFLQAIAGFMQQQTKASPAPLSRTELSQLGIHLRKALSNLVDSGVPNVLGHLDLNPGNILVTKNNCIFLDWEEACVGQPVLTLQYLLEHLRRLRSMNEHWQRKLISAYVETWRCFVQPRVLIESLEVAPCLAAFAHAVAGDLWRKVDPQRDAASARYLRSLARRMKREADAWPAAQSQRSVPCQN